MTCDFTSFLTVHISIISGQCFDDNERLCAVELDQFTVEKISPRVRSVLKNFALVMSVVIKRAHLMYPVYR